MGSSGYRLMAGYLRAGRAVRVGPVVLLLVITSVGPALAAKAAEKPAESFHWPAHEFPAEEPVKGSALSRQPDEVAESKREVPTEDGGKKEEGVALVARVSRRAIAKGSIRVASGEFIPWKGIRPGVYRVSARVKFDGPLHIIGTPIELSVRAAESARHRQVKAVTQAFTNCDFRAPGEYETISFLHEVDPTCSKRLAERNSRHPWHYGHYLEEIYPDWRDNRPEEKPTPHPKGIAVTLNLARTKYSSRTGKPPNSMRSVSVDWIKLERINPSPSITVRHVRALKRWMRPGEETSFDVAVENFGETGYTRQLRVVLERGIAEQTVVHQEAVTLKPGQAATLTVPWTTTQDTPIWGYEVRAEIRADGKVESSARDFFNVHPEAYTVLLMGTRFRRVDPFREWRTCNNLVEVFAATSGDCAQILPDNDQWLCGMSKVASSYKIVNNVIEHNRSMGVATHMYLFAGGTSYPLLDLYVRKPHYFSSRITATDQVYRMLRETAATIKEHDFNTGPFEMPKIPHTEHHLNHWFPALMDKITREAVEFVRRTGYQGIRFDVGIFSPKSVRTVFGEALPFDGSKTMAHAAANFDGFRATLQEEFPGFEFGANMDSWAYLERVGKRNVTPPPPETYPEFVAFAKAHGMFMDEGTMSAPFYSHYMNRFEDALWGMVQKREMVRQYGGVYQLFSPHRDGRGYFAHDDIYWAIMIAASGSCYVGGYSPPPYSEDSIGHFLVRFGEFFRSTGLRTLPDAPDKIFVDSPTEVWYADTAMWEDRGGRRRYVIPLINPPVNDRLRRNKTNELPEPLDEPFAIEIQVPDGFGKAAAWMLTWEPRIACVPLGVQIDGETATVEMPEIKLFRTLVIEFDK